MEVQKDADGSKSANCGTFITEMCHFTSHG